MNRLIFFVAILFICTVTFAQKQDKALALETADTTNFSVNNQAGWQLFNSYVAAVKTDSVTIEIVIQHSRTLDWAQEQLVGHIKPETLFPKANQTVSFNLLFDLYQLRVEPSGKCYLRLTSGSLPDGDPVIIPIRVVYKR
jgi:hypothetical protein